MKRGFYLQIDKDGNSNYSYKTSKGYAKLFYSRSGNWTLPFKGKLAAKLEDTGDLFKVTFKSGREVTLDVCELHELQWLVDLYSDTNPKTFSKFLRVNR